jgi:DNA-binding NtrC family response regulator
MTDNDCTRARNQTFTARIVCLDGQRDICRQTEEIFGNDDKLDIVFEKSLEKVLDLVEHEICDVLLASSSMVREGRMDWLEFLEVMTAKSPWTQIIFLIKPRELALASKALKAGSYHYAKLPISNEELKLLVEAALESRPNVDLHSEARREHRKKRFEDMVGISSGMKSVYRMIRQAAATDIPVLLTGETGVGKDLAARAIHQLSSRVDHIFLPVHLGSLPTDLAPSELFGHAKGAFTGAHADCAGAFERAHGGTVFLDEISTIDDRIQISLLRLIESKTFYRLGGSAAIRTDVRLIAATNEELEDAVAAGRFREDLFYRLEVFRIHIPPLRDRQGDIPLLIQDFLHRYNKDYGKKILGLSPETLSMLDAYDWPGNVRELKNVIHRAVVVCTGEVITPQHLTRRIRPGDGLKRNVVLPIGTSFEEAERKLLEKTLQATGNSRSQAAAILGVSRGTLYNKMKKYALAKPGHVE